MKLFKNALFMLTLMFFAASLSSVEKPNLNDQLMSAVVNGNVEAVKAVIAAGADVNATADAFRRTPLFMAADKGHTDIVRILMAAGANDPEFESIFVSAALKGNTEMVKALIVKDPNISCDVLETAYMVVNRRNTELVNIIKHLRSQYNSSEIVD